MNALARAIEGTLAGNIGAKVKRLDYDNGWTFRGGTGMTTAKQLEAYLGLKAAPVAVTFQTTAPAGVPPFAIAA